MEIVIVLYAILCMTLLLSWLAIPKIEIKDGDFGIEILLSVLIPIRNEAENLPDLLKDIESQFLDKNNFEVLFIDDNSNDNSLEIINDFSKTAKSKIKVIPLLQTERGNSPKKAGISKAIQHAQGKYIVSTDGDCRLPQTWLQCILGAFKNSNAKFISGPVSFSMLKSKPLWSRFQQIEFSSLVGSGAASINLKSPNMCSGANIAYHKEIFVEVNGYQGNDNLASGDDEFLMHKVAKLYPNGIFFLKSRKAIVTTKPPKNYKEFYHQRVRWASKWNHYKSLGPTLMAVFIFTANAAFLYFLISKNETWVLLKIIPEFIFLSVLQIFFRQKDNILLIFPLQLVYPFYIIWIALATLLKKPFSWKD